MVVGMWLANIMSPPPPGCCLGPCAVYLFSRKEERKYKRVGEGYRITVFRQTGEYLQSQMVEKMSQTQLVHTLFIYKV